MLSDFEDPSTLSSFTTPLSEYRLERGGAGMEGGKDHKWLRISAPMVRYSKLPFRLLVRKYNVDLCYSPMIMADCFVKSPEARLCEFQTCSQDQPLIVQFASNNASNFSLASLLVAPYVHGIDLNCGCPQKWALQEGIGAALLDHPPPWETVVDMIQQAKRRSLKPISVKIRILKDLNATIDMARSFEAAGVDWICVHGRNKNQRPHEPVNIEAIRLIKESLNIPVFANGNVFTLDDAESLQRETKADGVMAARGILENPCLFSGKLPDEKCISEFIRLSILYSSPTPIFHHHLSLMTRKLLQPSDHRILNSLATSSTPTLLDFMQQLKIA